MVPALSLASGRRPAAVLVGLVLAAFLAPTASAADFDKLDSSLKLIPADAAYYGSSLRMKEQIDIVAKSRAWAKIWSLPGVQMGWKMLESEYKPGGKLAPVHAFFQEEDNKELLALLADAGSNEIFVYGGEEWVGFIDLIKRVVSAVQYEPAKAALTGNDGGHSSTELQMIAGLRVLAKNPDAIKVPDLVLGAKLTNSKRVEKQLDRLEKLLDMAAKHVPELKGRYKFVKVNDGNFLTLTLDGGLVPWDDIPWNKVEDKPGEYAPLLRKLKSLTVTFSVGVQHGYLMVSVGGTTEQLGRIGGRGPKLDSRPELKPLAKFADRKIVSLSYVSKALLSQVMGPTDYSSYLDLAKAALPKANVPEEQQKRILKDLEALAKEIQADPPEIGALVDIAFMTERGFESYAYNYTKDKIRDSSKPLTLLNHVGGNPILAVVGRTKVTGESYAAASKWVKILWGHADEIARVNLKGNDKDQYITISEKLIPIFRRLDETTAKNLIPALADGQAGFVLDAKWSSKQWIDKAPKTPTALPLPEIAIVLGVSDAVKLRKATSDYFDIANDMIGAIRSLAAAAGAIGDFKIPDPMSVKRPSGTLFYYTLPPQLGLDAQIVPTAGLSEKVAVLTLSHAHAERLLKATPLKVDGGPLADLKKPLSGALVFNWPLFVDALTPWVELGANSIMDSELRDAPKKARDEILDQVRTVLEVLKVYRGSTAATYLEDGVTVTHSETVIKDLEK